MIKAKIVAHSINKQGDELISVLATFPRIILAEVNTHRMLSKNTSSSRAIPFKKMVEAVQNNPFIPIAWQKEHIGMQGYEYFTTEQANEIYNTDEWVDGHLAKEAHVRNWLHARDKAIDMAVILNEGKVTKQLCNRLLEPFMWTTMLITGSKEGWDNFFNLRCPQYKIHQGTYKSKKEALKYGLSNGELKNWSDLDWLQNNEGQAEIHIMDLAEKIYDAMNESTPRQLQAGEWHIPFGDKMEIPAVQSTIEQGGYDPNNPAPDNVLYRNVQEQQVKISTAMAAHTSYTIVGGEAVKSYEKWIELHDKLIAYDPPHSSPLEHCARAMSDYEYDTFVKGKITDRRGVYDFQNPYDYSREESIKNRKNVGGWCNNLKGFIPYRYMIDNNLI